MKEVTLKQIAENLGISVTTVSKALKDYKDVSKETKALVRAEAKALNYKPNVFAVNLRTKESKTVGLIIPEVVHHFFSSVINGLCIPPVLSGRSGACLLYSTLFANLPILQLGISQSVLNARCCRLTFSDEI